jgi:type II secretory pathway pseudopilin PulG
MSLRPLSTAERGVSLIEATIILSVFAVLTAIMAPAVAAYVDTARQARAREDVSVLGTAIQEFIADGAENQFLVNGSDGAQIYDPPTRVDTNRVNLLVSDGDIPVLSAAMAGDTYWTLTVLAANFVDTISNHLLENTPFGAAASQYRNPTDVNINPIGGKLADYARNSSSGFNASYSWRGAYLRGPVDTDPWGNRYAVNVMFLDPQPTALIPAGALAASGSPAFAAYPRMDTFVMSAGPDEEIDTRAAQDGAVPGDDDFIFIVAANAD